MTFCKYSFTLSAIFLSTFLLAQDAGLQNLITKIQAQVGEVADAKTTYKQELESKGQGLVLYSYDEIDNKKGDATSHSFEFNLADLDPYAVRQETSGDIILVAMTCAGKQKLVKETEDGEGKGFDDEVEIYCADIDAARALVESIKAAIPVAKNIVEKRLSLNDMAAAESWLAQNVGTVNDNDETVEQTIAKGEYPGSVVFTKNVRDDKGTSSESFTFNLADVNPNSLQFDISGNVVGIKLETQRDRKVIQHIEDGEQQNFDDEVVILNQNLEQARDLKTALALVIPMAEEKVKDVLPELNSSAAALAEAAKYFGQIKYGETVLEQSMTQECIATFTVVENDEKGSEKNEYRVNLMDINTAVFDYEISGKKMYFEPKILEESKLIKSFENDAFDGYEKDFKIYVENAETGRRFGHALKRTIELCKENYKFPYEENEAAILKWITENVGNVSVDETTYEQKVEFAEAGNSDKIKFSKIEIDDKGGVKEIYEFNVSDLNYRSLKYDISGKELAVEIGTKYDEEIIKHYEDGEIQKYKSEIAVVFDDLEEARAFFNGLEVILKGKEE